MLLNQNYFLIDNVLQLLVECMIALNTVDNLDLMSNKVVGDKNKAAVVCCNHSDTKRKKINKTKQRNENSKLLNSALWLRED